VTKLGPIWQCAACSRSVFATWDNDAKCFVPESKYWEGGRWGPFHKVFCGAEHATMYHNQQTVAQS